MCYVWHPQRRICVVHIFVFFVSFGCNIEALVLACGPGVAEISSLATLYYFYVRSTTYHTISLPTVNDQNTDTATPTKQNVTDRELDPTKPQSTGNDKLKTQLSTETLTLVTINIEGFHAYCEYRLLHRHALCGALLDPELCSHQKTWLNIRNLVGSHRACAFRMCVANVLVKEGYRPCLLKFGDIPDCREIPLY
jgi:hypothetical protein